MAPLRDHAPLIIKRSRLPSIRPGAFCAANPDRCRSRGRPRAARAIATFDQRRSARAVPHARHARQNPLKDAHGRLDSAVLAAYGFKPKADMLEQLLTLNQLVAKRIAEGQAVAALGMPVAVSTFGTRTMLRIGSPQHRPRMLTYPLSCRTSCPPASFSNGR